MKTRIALTLLPLFAAAAVGGQALAAPPAAKTKPAEAPAASAPAKAGKGDHKSGKHHEHRAKKADRTDAGQRKAK